MIGAGNYEGTLFRARGQDAFTRRSHHQHAIDIVISGMSPSWNCITAAMTVVQRHALIRPIKDGRFIHVIPDAVNSGGEKILIEHAPPGASLRPGEIREHT